MTAPEAAIRDKLVRRLDLLEPGLTVVAAEPHLPNIHGSSGFIDILARDRFDNLVIVEIKRSDSAARQALHELLKYTGLLRQNHGLPPDRLRCMVVSTVWRELLVPFSEFTRAVPFSVTGFDLVVDRDGTPIEAKVVQPAPEDPVLALSPVHWIGCSSTEDRRRSVLAEIDSVLAKAAVEDYLALFIDHVLSNSTVVYPYVCYLLLGRIPRETVASLREHNILGIGDYCDEKDTYTDTDTDHPEWQGEEAVVAGLYVIGQCDSAEHGYPEKLAGLLSSSWRVKAVHRRGKFSSRAVYPDDVLIRLCAGVESRNAVMFSTFLRPAFLLRWNKTLDDLTYTLEGNRAWKQGALHYLAEIAKSYPDGSVSIRIYNPMNFLVHLHQAVKKCEPAYLPAMQIMIVDGESKELRCLIGRLSWDGTTPNSPVEVVRQVFGGSDDFFLSQQLHTAWEYEETLCRLHGVSYRLIEVVERVDKPPEFRELTFIPEAATGSTQKEPTSRLMPFSRSRPSTSKRWHNSWLNSQTSKCDGPVQTRFPCERKRVLEWGPRSARRGRPALF